ncbi:Phage tail sheath protein [Cohnella sp. OV330]|uniref:phage tail sheath subtilisin-like domain-containing protein n=1 Tax=Cohnella sp. OV330 TaxID=1855288 RepID=UPI0008E27916|nr:phage tail sheath subtilisin-like domain-containing protein [Cohnella sp. OV330]SFB62594.1 Phage tail sheath protein [Cohnella sp. OV330]
MGLPEININFASLAVSAITRSGRGVVALILKDDTSTFDSVEYKSVADVKANDWTAANLALIKLAFLGIPSKVIVERLDADASDYNAALTRLAGKRWNYLAAPGIQSADAATVATQIKTWRTNKKTFKAVLPNSVSDHESIINFATEGIVVGATTYTASQYTARIAGLLAGMPLTRSATYYELSEVSAITESDDPDGDIDDGKLILISDDGKIKIGRGVNSLTTLTGKSADFQKIKIIEGHDLVADDITRTFKDEYVGKVNNSYDNQALFITAANAYIRGLQGEVLDPSGSNTVGVNLEAQRLAWEAIGTDTSDWDDKKVKETSFGSKVFISGSLKFLDAIEDLDFNISV